MRSVRKYDCSINSEITLVLNDKDQVIGVEVYFEEPKDLIDFRLEEIFMIRRVVRPHQVPAPPPAPPSPRMVRPQTTTSQSQKPCGGCK